MKKLLVVLLLLVSPLTVFASTNTFSGSFTRSSSQYSYIANNLGVTGGNITIEGWMYLSSAPAADGDQRAIFSQQDNGTAVQYALAYVNVTGTLILRATRSKAGVATNNADWTQTLSLNTWYHVVLTYDGSNVTLYTALQNGTHTQRAQTASSGSGGGFTVPSCASMGIILNTRTSGDSCLQSVNNGVAALSDMDGLIDDVRVWSTARSTAQMDANFQTQLTGSETGLVAYYQLNNDWNDLTSNAFNLTTSGSPTFSTTVPFVGATVAAFQLWAMSLF